MNVRRRSTSVGLAGAIALGLTFTGGAAQAAVLPSSSSAEAVAAHAIPHLSGTWKQTNSHSKEAWQVATIKGDTITIKWVFIDDGDKATALYWKGSFTKPTRSGDHSWVSKGDTDAMDSALLASQDSKKTFMYKDGELRYELSALGTTMTVRMTKR